LLRQRIRQELDEKGKGGRTLCIVGVALIPVGVPEIAGGEKKKPEHIHNTGNHHAVKYGRGLPRKKREEENFNQLNQ